MRIQKLCCTEISPALASSVRAARAALLWYYRSLVSVFDIAGPRLVIQEALHISSSYRKITNVC